MKIALLGDLHFGIKGFDENFFENQMRFFEQQFFPYLKENNITHVIQLGDLLDNRKVMNIKMFDELCVRFFKPMEEEGIEFHTILGNHDIYYSSTLEVNLIKYFEKLHPNVKLYQKKTTVELGNRVFTFVPWLIKQSALDPSDFSSADYLIGHFEIRNFLMTKGHVDEKSDLTSDFFVKAKKLKKVFSGHYHIQSSDGFISFLGTPYQLNWGDYKTKRGFFVLDEDDLSFIPNTASAKFVKIKYNDTKPKKIELSGYADEKLYFDTVKDLPDLTNHIVKFFINEASDKEYESEIFELNQTGLKFEVVNNVEITQLIGVDYQEQAENFGGTELLLKIVKSDYPDLLPFLSEILEEIE